MNKKIKIILLILILILLVLIIRSTYSKYIAEAGAVIDKNIAQWVIKINDTDITVQKEDSVEDLEEGVNFEITGDDIVWESNSHVVEGKAAPGIKGYFYLRIDPEKTQTALKYTIDFDLSKILEKNIKFRINKITEENGKQIHIKSETKTALSTIQRIKELDEIKSTNENTRLDIIKVELEWVEDETLGKFDTKVGENIEQLLNIPVKVDVIQYTGEGYDF